MFLDPEVVIAGGEKHNLLVVVVISAAEHIHCVVEKLAFIGTNNCVSEHFSLLPLLNSVPSPRIYSNKYQILIFLIMPYFLQHVVG